MELNTVVIGSGLASAFFCESYLKKNQEIDIISNNFLNNIDTSLDKNLINKLPLQIKNNDLKYISDYIYKNNIQINDNANIFGSLSKWGNSNYWGYGLDNIMDEDLLSFDNIQKNRIKDIFKKVYIKNSLIGSPDENIDQKSNYKKNPIYKLYENINSNFNVTKTFLGINRNFLNNASNKTDWSKIRTSHDSLNPETYFSKISKNKKINFHNYFVDNIKKIDDLYFLECINNDNNRVVIKVKKIILCCGTIGTTRLVTNLVKHKNELKILHHPMNFSLYLSKNKIIDKNFLPAIFNIKSFVSKNINANSNIRFSSPEIESKMIEMYRYLFLFNFQKKMLNKFSNYFLLCNNYLETKFSNLYFKNDLAKINIYSKKDNSILKNLNLVSKHISINLQNKNLIFPFYKNFFPGFGADYHYLGTIPISDNLTDLGVNNESELNNFKNIYIADGSVINFKTNTSPMGLIISNAYRIGEIVSNK